MEEKRRGRARPKAKEEGGGGRSQLAQDLTPVGRGLVQGVAALMTLLGPEEGVAILLGMVNQLETNLQQEAHLGPEQARTATAALLRQALSQLETEGLAVETGAQRVQAPPGVLH